MYTPKPLTQMLLCAGLIASAALARAEGETLAQKEYWANQLDYTQRSLASIQENCGSTLAFSYEKTSWWSHKDALLEAGASPNGRCDDVLNAVINVCRSSPAAAKAVASSVKSVDCGYGGMDSGFKLTLTAGKLQYNVEVNRANIGEEIERYLKNNL
jgi:hypothetical protein